MFQISSSLPWASNHVYVLLWIQVLAVSEGFKQQ